ncbi:MAG: hypothetical protein WC746_05665 [archaeon]|jgi:hypothetical protein
MLKRLKVFEAGAGKHPNGIVNQALRSQKKRGGRTFLASDLELREEETLRRHSLSTSPENLKLVKGCSFAELKKAPSASMNLIFDSFFVLDISINRHPSQRMQTVAEYLNEAKRVLTPRGRIISIQGFFNANTVAQVAKSVGLRAHIVRLSPRQLETSSSDAIKLRSTQQKRMQIAIENISRDPFVKPYVEEWMKQNKAKDVSETNYPVAIVIRK